MNLAMCCSLTVSPRLQLVRHLSDFEILGCWPSRDNAAQAFPPRLTSTVTCLDNLGASGLQGRTQTPVNLATAKFRMRNHVNVSLWTGQGKQVFHSFLACTC